MPEIILERVEEAPEPSGPPQPAEPPEPTASVKQIPEEVTSEPILEEQHIPEPPVPTVPEPVAKKRGRPPKAKAEAPPPKPPKPAPKPKATRAKKPPPPPESDSSSSEDMDETLRNVYNHVARPDMETAILQFLVNKKQSEQTRRRELWGRLAQM